MKRKSDLREKNKNQECSLQKTNDKCILKSTNDETCHLLLRGHITWEQSWPLGFSNIKVRGAFDKHAFTGVVEVKA